MVDRDPLAHLPLSDLEPAGATGLDDRRAALRGQLDHQFPPDEHREDLAAYTQPRLLAEACAFLDAWLTNQVGRDRGEGVGSLGFGWYHRASVLSPTEKAPNP